MPKKVKNNKKRSVQIRNKNKNANSIQININSNNRRKGGGTSRPQQPAHSSIIMSVPHVPHIPTDTGTQHLYPMLNDIRERLEAKAKQPQEVKEIVGGGEDATIIKSGPVKPEPVAVNHNQTVQFEQNPLDIVKVAKEDKTTIKKPNYTNSSSNSSSSFSSSGSSRTLSDPSFFKPPSRPLPPRPDGTPIRDAPPPIKHYIPKTPFHGYTNSQGQIYNANTRRWNNPKTFARYEKKNG